MQLLLHHRNFSLLWFGGLISLAGDRVLRVALPFYVYQQTQSTLATALMVAAELLPMLLLGTVAGVFVDRWDRRRAMIVASILQGLSLLLLALVNSAEQIWLVYLVSFIQACLGTFFSPAENALLPSLVDKEQLLQANSLNSLNNNLARLFGPPLGGVLLAAGGLPVVVLVDSISFLLAAAMIALVVVPARVAPAQPSSAGARAAWNRLWSEWLEGLRLVWRMREIRILFLVLVLISFGGTMYDPLTPAFVESILKAGPEGYGLLTTVQAVGGIIGGFVVGRIGKRFKTGALLGWSCVATGLLLLVQHNIPYFYLALLLGFLVGITAVATGASAQTMAQESVPDEYLGRAFGALGTTIALLSLFGVLGLSGILGQLVGIVPMLSLADVITVSAGLIGVFMLGSSVRLRSASRVVSET